MDDADTFTDNVCRELEALSVQIVNTTLRVDGPIVISRYLRSGPAMLRAQRDEPPLPPLPLAPTQPKQKKDDDEWMPNPDEEDSADERFKTRDEQEN